MDMVLLYPPDERINVLAPIVRGRKGEFKKELRAIRERGFKLAIEAQQHMAFAAPVVGQIARGVLHHTHPNVIEVLGAPSGQPLYARVLCLLNQ